MSKPSSDVPAVDVLTEPERRRRSAEEKLAIDGELFELAASEVPSL